MIANHEDCRGSCYKIVEKKLKTEQRMTKCVIIIAENHIQIFFGLKFLIQKNFLEILKLFILRIFPETSVAITTHAF